MIKIILLMVVCTLAASLSLFANGNEFGGDFSWNFLAPSERSVRLSAVDMQERMLSGAYQAEGMVPNNFAMDCAINIDATGNLSDLQSDGNAGPTVAINDNTVRADTVGNEVASTTPLGEGGSTDQSNDGSTLSADVSETDLINNVDSPHSGDNDYNPHDLVGQSNKDSTIQAMAESNEVCNTKYTPIERLGQLN